jgi:dienelactone hydrolase
MRSLVLLAAVLFGAPALADTNDDLVKQGFNFTYGVTAQGSPAKVQFLIAPSDGPLEIALSFDAESDVRLVGPHDAVIAQWQAARGDLRLARALPAGRYTVDITPAAGARVHGVVGVKGPVVGECALDPARVSEHAPGKGFRWPYLLVRPKAPATTTLLVFPNNTGFATDDVELIRAAATCQLRNDLALADRLGTPVLVPLFPRPAAPGSNLYLHALTRAALVAKSPAVARVDLQLIAMIDDARTVLAAQKLTVDPRVLIAGFSAAGSFANRFAVLHPDRTRAAAVGSPGGWPLAPVESDGRDRLPYPVGIADAKTLTGGAIDRAALGKVAFFFFLGGDDTNDAVVYRDSFSTTDEKLVMRKFGKTPVDRWRAAQRLYEQAKLHATFKLYPGVAHEVTPAMLADVEAALRAALSSGQ